MAGSQIYVQYTLKISTSTPTSSCHNNSSLPQWSPNGPPMVTTSWIYRLHADQLKTPTPIINKRFVGDLIWITYNYDNTLGPYKIIYDYIIIMNN